MLGFYARGHTHWMLIGGSTIALGLVACAPALPQPNIYAVTPSSIDNDTDHTITLVGDSFYPQIQITGDDALDVDRQFTVQLINRTGEDAVEAELTGVVQDSYEQLSVTVPEGLTPGSYDVRVLTSAGQQDTLAAGLYVAETNADRFELTTDTQTYPTHTDVRLHLSVLTADGAPLGEDFPVIVEVVSEDGLIAFRETLDGQRSLADRNGVEGLLDGGEGFLEFSTTESGRYTFHATVPEEARFLASEDIHSQLSLWFVPGEIEELSLTLDAEQATTGDDVRATMTLLDASGNPTTYPLSQTFLVEEECSNEQGSFQQAIVFPAQTSSIDFYVQPHIVTGAVGCEENRFEARLIAAGDSNLVATSAPIEVLPGAPSSLEVETTFTTALEAGQQLAQMSVVAKDAYGNLLTDYQQDLRFESSLEGSVSSACLPWQQGRVLCGVDLYRAGHSLVDVFSADGLSGQSASIEVMPGPPSSVTIDTASGSSQAGVLRVFELTLEDTYGNLAQLPEGDDALSFSAPGEAVECALSSGDIGWFQYDCLFTHAADGVSLTAQTGSVEGVSQPFSVINGTLSTVSVSSPGDIVAGTPFSVTLQGADAYGNPFIEAAGGSKLIDLFDDSGDLSEQVTLGADGSVTVTSLRLVTAWDDNSLGAYQAGSWLGQSEHFDVSPADVDRFDVTTARTWSLVGESVDVSIRAVDAYDNTTEDYTFDPVALADGDGLVSSSAGLGDEVELPPFVDGLAAVSFSFDTAGLGDTLQVTIGDLEGSSPSIDAVRSDCDAGPDAVLTVDGLEDAVLCVNGNITDSVSISSSGSSAGSSSLSSWHFQTGEGSWVRQTSDSLSHAWTREGVFTPEVLVVDASGCADTASAVVYAADDDGLPAGPISIEVAAASLDADTTGSSGETVVTISAQDCAGAVASGDLLVRADIGKISSDTSTVSATGGGLSVTLDSLGEAQVAWVTGSQLYGDVDGTVWTGRQDGLAEGSVAAPIDNDAVLPFVVSVDPVGTLSSSTDVFSVTFSEPIDSTTVSDAISVLDPDGMAVEVLDYEVNGSTVSVDLSETVDPDQQWMLTIDQGILDLSGNLLSGDASGSAADFSLLLGDVSDTAPDMSSCSADLALFRPDGDDGTSSESDLVELTFDATAKASWWLLSIADSDGEVVTRIVESASASKGSAVWGGRGLDGLVLPSGGYIVTISALDAHWNAGSSCSTDVEISHTLE